MRDQHSGNLVAVTQRLQLSRAFSRRNCVYPSRKPTGVRYIKKAEAPWSLPFPIRSLAPSYIFCAGAFIAGEAESFGAAIGAGFTTGVPP